MKKLWRIVLVGAVLGLGAVTPDVAHATTPPSSTPEPIDEGESNDNAGDGALPGATVPSAGQPVDAPLIPVPPGCDQPVEPHTVFLGTVIEKDYRTVRFRIDQVRAGSPQPFADNKQIDVRYGIDAQYLDEDEQYLVGVLVDPVLGLVTSRVTEPIEDFGGDEVIGLGESAIDCPEFEDPHRTLLPDGSSIDGDLLDPLGGSQRALLGAVLTPLAVVFAVVFALALLRNGGKLAVRAASGAPLRDR